MSIIAIVGSGAWGSALAHVLRNTPHQIRLCSGRDYATLPHSLQGAEVVFLAVKSAAVAAVLPLMASALPANTPVVQTAKGLTMPHAQPLITLQQHYLPQCVPLVLSGPAFAANLQNNLPAAISLACQNLDVAQQVQNLFAGTALRPYICRDVVGVSLGGALKNVIAIACGLTTGMNLGVSASASVATRGFAEMRRIAQTFGADEQTLCGLSGLGDLMLTAASTQSRNFLYGYTLGQNAQQYAHAPTNTVEGIGTANAMMQQYAQLDLPLCAAVHAVCQGVATPAQAAAALLERPLCREV